MFSPKEPLIAHLHAGSNEVCSADKWTVESLQSRGVLMYLNRLFNTETALTSKTQRNTNLINHIS